MKALGLLILFLMGMRCTEYLLRPVGNCLGNCRHCQQNDLEVCTGAPESICSLGYSQELNGKKCIPDEVHRDQIQELNYFSDNPTVEGWSTKKYETCLYPGNMNTTHKFNILGFFQHTNIVQKSFPIKSYHRSAIVSFNLIRNYWEPFNDYLTIALKTNNKVLSSNEVSFDSRELVNKDPFRCHGQPYKLEKYQIQAVLGEHSDTELILSFESDMSQNSQWGITNIHLLIGCKNFIAANQQGECKTCEQGFYKIMNNFDKIIQCQRCPGICMQCSSPQVCTKCVQGLRAYNNQCYNIDKYNRQQIKLQGEATCMNKSFIASQDGMITLGEVQMPEHTHIAITFSIFYDPSSWDASTELHVFINEQDVHQFNSSSLKTFTTGQCSFFPSGVFEHQKLVTPYLSSTVLEVSLGLQIKNNNKKVILGLSSEGINFLYYLCTEHCVKCNRDNNECLQCKKGYRYQNKICVDQSTKPKTEPKNQSKPEAQAKPKVETQPEGELKPKPVPKSAPEVKTKSGQEVKTKPQNGQQSQPLTGEKQKSQKKDQVKKQPKEEPKSTQEQEKFPSLNQQGKNQTQKDKNKKQQQEQRPKTSTKKQPRPAYQPKPPVLEPTTPQSQERIVVEFHPTDYKSNNTGINMLLKYPPNYQVREFKAALDKLPGQWLPVTNTRVRGGLQSVTILINQSVINGTIGLYSNSYFKNRTYGLEGGDLNETLRGLQGESQMGLIKKTHIERYDYISPEKAQQIISSGYILMLVSWVAIIGVTLSVPLSLGVVWEQLILSAQVVFLHTYIYSEYLPLTLKQPLNALQRIQNLDYFLKRDAESIEHILLGNTVQQSPLRLAQFKTDINFTRGFYPIMIVNCLFLIWFGVSLVVARILKKVREKSNWQEGLATVMNKISNRKVNYFDQIWRYQFLSIFWLCLIQSYNLYYPIDAQSSSLVNTFLCLTVLLVTLSWPVGVLVYTQQQRKHLETIEFNEYFADIYFGKLNKKSTPSVLTTIYFTIKHLKFLFYTLAATCLGNYPLAGLLPAILLQTGELFYILKLKIHQDKAYTLFRIIQNTTFILIGVLMLILYEVSSFVDEKLYFQIGSSIYAIMLVTIVNSLFRVVYIFCVKLGIGCKKGQPYSDKNIFFEDPQETGRHI